MNKDKIVCITAYDFITSRWLSLCNSVDVCLVGDSLSQTVLGHKNTTQITLQEMIHHCKAAAAALKHPLLVCDLPFGSFEQRKEKAVESSIMLVKHGGAEVQE